MIFAIFKTWLGCCVSFCIENAVLHQNALTHTVEHVKCIMWIFFVWSFNEEKNLKWTIASLILKCLSTESKPPKKEKESVFDMSYLFFRWRGWLLYELWLHSVIYLTHISTTPSYPFSASVSWYTHIGRNRVSFFDQPFPLIASSCEESTILCAEV